MMYVDKRDENITIYFTKFPNGSIIKLPTIIPLNVFYFPFKLNVDEIPKR